MTFFNTFSSNTLAGSGNQYFFTAEEGTVHTGRVFYKIFHGGSYRYSLLFSNIVDSTFADGSVSFRNHICDTWHIFEAKIGRCKGEAIPADFYEPVHAESVNRQVVDFQPLTFDGKTEKTVAPGEFFCCDPVSLAFDKGDYLCLEMTFSGRTIPYHEETLLPVYLKQGDTWVYTKAMPLPGMVGCDRPVKARIGYLGDSITQGIGTQLNSYTHWCAQLSEKWKKDYAYWNLGLGFGRATDLSSNGAWRYKALQNDSAVVCYGVNDILQGVPEEEIKAALDTIVSTLKNAGKKVILQTIPPFDYEGENIAKWKRINRYILTVLSEKVDLLFDVVPILQVSEELPHLAKFGGHPDAAGCTAWANALYEAIAASHVLD